MDRLEEFIRNNRDGLDKLDPPVNVWKNIRKSLQQGKFPVIKWLAAAAALVIILSSSVFLLKKGVRGRELADPHLLQLKETEIYYNNLANSLYKQAAPMLTGSPGMQKELTADITCLDSICTGIRKDLKDNVANEEVIKALIRNYRMKIQILEEMLEILNEDENIPEKNKSHGL